MQLVYLDEAGIGKISQEPYLVLAGVMIDADKKWKEVEKFVASLAKEYFPTFVPYYGRQFVFHAKDIWHGSGYFPRSEWSRAKRMKVLERLAEIPSEFELTIVGSFVERKSFYESLRESRPHMEESKYFEWSYAFVFMNTARRIERWMQEKAPNEVAMIIAEDTDRVKGLISAFHSSFTDRTAPILGRAFQSKHIVDSVHFAKKDASTLLQIADHSAFILKRKMMKCEHSQKLYAAIAPRLSLRSAGGRSLVLTIPETDYKVIPRDEAQDASQTPATIKPSRGKR